VLAKRTKDRVRSIKVLGWIESKESNRSRGFSLRFARHMKRSKNYQEGQGPRCKPAMSSPTSGQNPHRRMEVLAGGGADDWSGYGLE
jgi:hypothetical protein